jgi:hypothetical protein
MKIKTLILGILLTYSFQLNAQSYDISMGVRLGTDMGITYKHRIAKRVTLEGIVQSSIYREEANVTVLAEKHMPFLTRRLNFYTGGGFHKGWVTSAKSDLTPEDPFGVTLIAGIEFTVARLNISWDYKPAINIIGGDKRLYSQSGISVRYVMKKRKIIDRKKRNNKKKDINWKFWEQ